jgi:hypothetical protein
MNEAEPILSVAFFRTASGNEPVREWVKSMPREECRIIGEDLKTVQFGWPLGMPLVRKLDHGERVPTSKLYLCLSPEGEIKNSPRF